MIDLVTLQQARIHLRISTTDSDADIGLKVSQASDLMWDYLKKTTVPTAWIDASTSPVAYNIPPHVQAAVLLMVGELFMNRESSIADVLSQTVRDLVHRHRDPAMA